MIITSRGRKASVDASPTHCYQIIIIMKDDSQKKWWLFVKPTIFWSMLELREKFRYMIQAQPLWASSFR